MRELLGPLDLMKMDKTLRCPFCGTEYQSSVEVDTDVWIEQLLGVKRPAMIVDVALKQTLFPHCLNKLASEARRMKWVKSLVSAQSIADKTLRFEDTSGRIPAILESARSFFKLGFVALYALRPLATFKEELDDVSYIVNLCFCSSPHFSL